MKGLNVAMLVVMAVLPAARTAAPERQVTGDGIVSATVNGAPGRFRIDAAAPAMPLLTADWAARAGLKGSLIGIGYSVGPRVIAGESAVARIAVAGDAPYKRRVGWLPKPYDAAVDGAIGPGGLPDPVVRFVLRASVAGERTATFRMVDEGGLGGGWGERFAVIDVGGAPLRVRFDLRHRATLATAGAALRLAQLQGGRFDGAVGEQEIAFGIVRPVRTLVLERPLAIGPLAIGRMGVRTADYGKANGIPDAKAPPPDPAEVVVTAKRKRDIDQDRLAIGADALARCSSIVFDKPARQIRLTCA